MKNKQEHRLRIENKQTYQNIKYIENYYSYNKFENRGEYKLPCNNCNKLYKGRTKINFKIIFNEHKKDFPISTEKSTFSENILNAGPRCDQWKRLCQFYILKTTQRELTLLKKWITCTTSCRITIRFTKYCSHFRIWQRPARTYTDDGILLAKGSCAILNFNEERRRH